MRGKKRKQLQKNEAHKEHADKKAAHMIKQSAQREKQRQIIKNVQREEIGR